MDDPLRADPVLLAGAVEEEAQRHEGSVNMVSRLTVEPYAVGDTVITPEQVIFFMLGPANRDPAAFTDPERFDIRRTHNPHLAFGAGIHFHLGAPLARLEVEIAFTQLLRRYSTLALADETSHWRGLINLRGLEAVPLRPGRSVSQVAPGG